MNVGVFERTEGETETTTRWTTSFSTLDHLSSEVHTALLAILSSRWPSSCGHCKICPSRVPSKKSKVLKIKMAWAPRMLIQVQNGQHISQTGKAKETTRLSVINHTCTTNRNLLTYVKWVKQTSWAKKKKKKRHLSHRQTAQWGWEAALHTWTASSAGRRVVFLKIGVRASRSIKTGSSCKSWSSKRSSSVPGSASSCVSLLPWKSDVALRLLREG